MQALSTPITLVASASVLGSAWCAGAISSLSLLSVPAVLGTGATTQVMLRQWSLLFNRGKLIPVISGLSFLGLGATAYSQGTRGQEWRGFALAGLCTSLLIVFTSIFVMPTNHMLTAATNGTGKLLTDDKVRALIKKWMDLNTVRIIFPLGGAVLGLWNLLV